MTEKIKTLLIGNDGFGPGAKKADTSSHLRLKRIHSGNNKSIFGGYDSSFSGKSLTYSGSRYETLSYAQDWEDAFLGHKGLSIDRCNALDLLSLKKPMHVQLD